MIFKRLAAIILSMLLVFIIGSGSAAVFADGVSTKNLVLGLPYDITTGEPTVYSHGNYEPDTYHIDTGQLTDGITALTDYNSSAWYRSFRSVSRIVTFDLGEFKAVRGFSAGFLHIRSMAIYAPRYVYVYLSENGVDYQRICTATPDFLQTDSTARRAEIGATFDKVYKARFVRVEFCSDIFAFCDEIRVFGTDELHGDEAIIIPDAAVKEPGYLTELGGVSDIIKIYNGYHPNQSIADNTAAELLPYIAYVQADGSYSDTMFDSLAFVPCHTDYPSGGRLVKTNGKAGAVMSDWLLYLENTFTKGINTDALNNVVGEVYQKLGIKGKFTVFFTLPFPTELEGPFGDISGDGKDEYCQTLEERVAILKWFTDLTYERFLSGKYANLKFGGFYWYRESINYSETDHEAELIRQTAQYLSKRNFNFLFDPFYLSVGFNQWKELGFDGAVMQPNLVFSEFYEPEMLGEFAETIKRHNLGVEIETGEPGHFSDDRTYKQYGLTYEYYLYYGWLTGYMDALHTYYQGAGPGTIYNFCYAGKETPKAVYLRSLYDKTYRFIKGTYTAYTPVVYIPDFETTAGQKYVRVEMIITDPDSDNGDFQVIFTKQPEHGTVNVLSNNRTLVYNANAGYSGIDTFEVVVFDKFTYSDPVTVTVTVVDTAITVSEEPSGEISEDELKKDKGYIWIILISAGVLVVLAVVTVLIIRSRKK